MKKNNKKTTTVKAAAKVKILTKTIKNPQVVDVKGMKLVSVALTDKGTLAIKYIAK